MSCKRNYPLRQAVLTATARNTYDFCQDCGDWFEENQALAATCAGFRHVNCPEAGDPFRNWRP